MSAQQLWGATGCVFYFNAHFLTLFGHFDRLVIDFNTGNTTEINKFLVSDQTKQKKNKIFI